VEALDYLPKNLAVSSGRAVLIDIPVPASKPATFVSLGSARDNGSSAHPRGHTSPHARVCLAWKESLRATPKRDRPSLLKLKKNDEPCQGLDQRARIQEQRRMLKPSENVAYEP
jgi:hypothetical protein